MLKHIKLITIRRLFASLMLLTCIILGFGTMFLERNISIIDDTWELFQTDRSEKSRLESALRAAIGYGGMIHEFKNFILRHESFRMDLIHKQIGSAEAVIQQYATLGVTSAETTALEDIQRVLTAYERAHIEADEFIRQGHTIAQIDGEVKVDDAPALRGLQTLRAEVRHALGPDTPLSKARVSADLRAAIGYGGMIHEFKNYVLRHDAERIAKIEDKLQQAHRSIAQYRILAPNRAETLALDDIESTLLNYGKNLDAITQMISTGATNKEIDQSVRIDDYPALRGLRVLDKEISLKIADRSGDVSRALKLVNRTLNISTWGVITLLLFVVIMAVWLLQRRVIDPILRLTRSMVQLADNDLSVKIDDHHQDNELGDMARTVMVFRENMIERDKAEMRLEDANDELNTQLDNIQQLREQSEAQTTKALALAEGLSAAREAAEKATSRAEEDEQRVSAVLNAVRDAIITLNSDFTIESFNPGAEDIFGYRSNEVIGKSITLLVAESARSKHEQLLNKLIASDHSLSERQNAMEVEAQHRDGHIFPFELSLSTMKIGDELKITGVGRDITERKKWVEDIERLAMTDPLTGLANRNHYNQRLEEAAAWSKRFNQPFALMLLDLDKFKPVNDTYGHPVGDALLQHVAKTLVGCCREIDTVARLGGDEFAVILLSTEKGLNVDVPAQRIIEQVSQPVTIEGHSITIGVSIGISGFPTCSSATEELQRQADVALYRAKEEGRNTYRIFKSEPANG